MCPKNSEISLTVAVVVYVTIAIYTPKMLQTFTYIILRTVSVPGTVTKFWAISLEALTVGSSVSWMTDAKSRVDAITVDAVEFVTFSCLLFRHVSHIIIDEMMKVKHQVFELHVVAKNKIVIIHCQC